MCIASRWTWEGVARLGVDGEVNGDAERYGKLRCGQAGGQMIFKKLIKR